MLILDVNLLVYARRRESERHAEYRSWLEAHLSGSEPIGTSSLVLSGFVRIVTNPRIYRVPTPIGAALEFCEIVLGSPAAVPVIPGARHWDLFADLCRLAGAKGNLVPDAYLAALVLEQGATLVTADRGFHRYPGLRVEHPLPADA